LRSFRLHFHCQTLVSGSFLTRKFPEPRPGFDCETRTKVSDVTFSSQNVTLRFDVTLTGFEKFVVETKNETIFLELGTNVTCFCSGSPTERRFLWVSPTESFFCFKVTHRKVWRLQCYPQKSACVWMLPTEKRFACKVPTENSTCSSLPTKEFTHKRVFLCKSTHRTAERVWVYPWNKA